MPVMDNKLSASGEPDGSAALMEKEVGKARVSWGRYLAFKAREIQSNTQTDQCLVSWTHLEFILSTSNPCRESPSENSM